MQVVVECQRDGKSEAESNTRSKSGDDGLSGGQSSIANASTLPIDHGLRKKASECPANYEMK